MLIQELKRSEIMKKILFFVSIFLFSINIVNADNHIYSIDISVNIDEYGNANIEELWKVKGYNGTEWYKVLNNLGNSEVSNFTVSMDNTLLTYKTWNVNESLSEKKGYYGINYTTNGLELCFGKYDYNKHVFKLNYTLSNFVFNVSDAQVIYFNFIDKLSNVDFDNFSLEISTYYNLPDTIDVWGYGYKGYAYVENGKIKMSNEGDMDNNYVVLLAKFPLNTFNTTNSYSKYNVFDDVYNLAQEGTFEYNYNTTFLDIILYILPTLINMAFFGFVAFIIYKASTSNKHGYIDNKKINKNNTPYFRDIPCNKDIYYANALASLNGWVSNETNILGAIFLKWIKNGIITINNDNKNSLILKQDPSITDSLESKLYDMIYKASIDGILEKKELEKWAKKNYTEYLNLFTKIKTEGINKLKEEGHIYKRKAKECKYKNVMDDYLYEEAKKLYGLKLFLDDFSNIKSKEAIEVNLWDEYLMFAYIFGNAKKVMKQFKNLYPEVIEDMNSHNLDFDTLIFLNNISYSSVSAASSARSAAQSYSSGGGGMSFGGGGGGSFGGGGGGSR
jgi:uncharacterized membrane protein YgcG